MKTTATSWKTLRAALWLALAASACGGGPGGPTGGTGHLHAALAGAATTHDVTEVHYRVVAGGSPCTAAAVAQMTIALRADVIPGADGGSGVAFADAFFVLAPGMYHVCAAPLAGAAPSADCAAVEGDATVTAEGSADLVLVSQCRGPDNGGVDVVTALNDPPVLIDLSVTPSKFVALGDTATIAAVARDPDGDALAFAFTVVSAPAGSTAPVVPIGPPNVPGPPQQTGHATFAPDVIGDYMLSVKVTDTHGASASLSFPIHGIDAALFDIVDLGSVIPDSLQTIAYGINNLGTAVGMSLNGCCAQAFETGRSPLYLPYPPITYALGINDAGTVVGDVDISAGGGCYEAMTFNSTSGPTLRGLLPGFPCSQGIAINNLDDIVGDAESPATQTTKAFLSSQTAMVDLGTLGGDSFALGINNARTVVGYSVPTGFTPPPNDPYRVGHAFAWTGGLGMRDLNDPSLVRGVQDGPLYKASAINASGQIVGYAAHPGGVLRSFRLDPDGDAYDFVDLGALGGFSYPLAMNSAGVAVGIDASAPGAALFNGSQALNLHAALPLSEQSHWTLGAATGINDSCQIVGYGQHDGTTTRAFLLTPRPRFHCPGQP
jgi:probable HAF family extracellular repeat protein